MIHEVMVPNKEAPYLIRARIVCLESEGSDRAVDLDKAQFNLRQRYHFRVDMSFDDPLARQNMLSGYHLQAESEDIRLTDKVSYGLPCFIENKAACEFSLVPWTVTEDGFTEFALDYGHEADLSGARIPVRLKIAS